MRQEEQGAVVGDVDDRKSGLTESFGHLSNQEKSVELGGA